LDVITGICMVCGHAGIVKGVSESGYEKWKAGMFIQLALPSLSADEREQLLTGTHPSCWDAMMPDEDEE
jgi:hypothetical protein